MHIIPAMKGWSFALYIYSSSCRLFIPNEYSQGSFQGQSSFDLLGTMMPCRWTRIAWPVERQAVRKAETTTSTPTVAQLTSVLNGSVMTLKISKSRYNRRHVSNDVKYNNTLPSVVVRWGTTMDTGGREGRSVPQAGGGELFRVMTFTLTFLQPCSPVSSTLMVRRVSCVLVTGCGYPDIATRALVSKLSSKCGVRTTPIPAAAMTTNWWYATMTLYTCTLERNSGSRSVWL